MKRRMKLPTIRDFCTSMTMVLLMAADVRKYSEFRFTSICCTDSAGTVGGAATIASYNRRIYSDCMARVFTKYQNFAAMLRTKSSLVLNI